MATTVGAAEYEISADDAKLIKTMSDVKKANKSAGDSFGKLDKQVDTSAKKMTKSAKAVSSSFNSMSGNIGRGSIQVQQFIGQVEGGVNPMIALSQQGADLGIVLGAPLAGVIASLTSSLINLLFPGLFKTAKETKKLEEALNALKEMTYETSDGTLVLSESIERLSRKSKEAAKIELANGIIKAREALKLATTEIDKSTKAWESWIATNAGDLPNATKQLAILDDAMKRTGQSQKELLENFDFAKGAIPALSTAVSSLSEDYGVTQTQALGLVRVFKQFQDDKTPASIQAVATAVNTVALSIKKPNDELIKLAKTINDAAIASGDASEVIKLFELALKDMGVALDDNTESSAKNKKSVDDMITALLDESNSLGMNARQRALVTAAINGGTDAEIEQIAKIFDSIDAYKEQTKAIKEKEAADKKAKETAKSDKTKAVSFATGVIGSGMSEAEKLALENKELLALKAKYNEDSAIFEKALTANEKKQSDLRTEIAKKETDDKIKAQYALANAVLSSISGFTTSLMSNMDEQSGAYKALFAIQQASAVAQTIVAAEQAAALTLAATASLGPAVSVAASNIVRGLGYASAGVIAGTAIAGRENGGSVNAGQMYQMGEGNKPEILQAGNSLAVVPGDNGRVFNQNQLDQIDSSGGSGFSIQIINEPGVVSMVVSQTDKEAIIRSAVNQAENNYVSQASSKQGKMHKANTQNYGTGNTTGRPT